MRATLRSAAVVAALCAFIALPARGAGIPTPNLGRDIMTGSLSGGGVYILRPNPTVPVAAIELWFRAPQTGFGSPTPGLARLAAETVAASIPVTGTALSKTIADAGGRLEINTYPDSIVVSALVPASDAQQIVRQMTAAYFSPVVTQQGVRLAQRDVSEEALLHAFTAGDTLRDLLVSQLFVTGPAHYPSLPKPAELAKIPFDQVSTFAARAFRAQNAILVVTGDVDRGVVDAAVQGRPASLSSEPPAASTTAGGPLPVLSKEYAEPGVGYGWIGPPIADEIDATALDFIADYLFRPATGIVSRLIDGTDVEVSGQFVTYRDPGIVLVEIWGGDPVAARAIVDRELAQMRTPLAPAAFAAARDAFMYHLLADMQTPGELADTLGWYTVEGNPAYAPGADTGRASYFAAVRALTPQRVAEAVRKYLSGPPVTVVLTTKTPAPAPSAAAAATVKP